MTLFWLPEAFEDLERLHAFLLGKSTAAAEKVLRLIDEGVDRLLEYPELGSPMDDDTKRRELFLPFGAGAYIVRYRILNESVVIIRVWHSRELRP